MMGIKVRAIVMGIVMEVVALVFLQPQHSIAQEHA